MRAYSHSVRNFIFKVKIIKPTYTIQEYEKFSSSDINEIIDVIEAGRENPKHKIKDVLSRSWLIAIARLGKEVVAAIILKNPTQDRKSQIFAVSNSQLNPDEFHFELGFWAVSEAYIGTGIGKEIIQKLLQSVNDKLVIFAISSKQMTVNYMIQNFNFEIMGNPFVLENTQKNYSLIIRNLSE